MHSHVIIPAAVELASEGFFFFPPSKIERMKRNVSFLNPTHFW